MKHHLPRMALVQQGCEANQDVWAILAAGCRSQRVVSGNSGSSKAAIIFFTLIVLCDCFLHFPGLQVCYKNWLRSCPDQNVSMTTLKELRQRTPTVSSHYQERILSVTNLVK